MGALFSKVAPIKDKNDAGADTTTTVLDYESSPTKFLDPRSPNPYRTPISNLQTLNAAKPVIRAQNLTTDEAISMSTVVTPTKLKTKLLRDLGYTLDSIDPRSPAQNFNRTPITFDDSIISDDFSLAGISLNESNLQTPIKENQPETFITPVHEDAKFAASKMDPRSPSIDVERTPLALNVLLTEDAQINDDSQSAADEVEKMPMEEEITAAMTTGTVRSMIYMDENREQPTTPNVKSGNTDKIRTPLSCLMNTQSCDNRNDKRLKIHNKPMLARTIFKDTTAHQNANKMNNSSSKIPVLRKSLSKEIN